MRKQQTKRKGPWHGRGQQEQNQVEETESTSSIVDQLARRGFNVDVQIGKPMRGRGKWGNLKAYSLDVNYKAIWYLDAQTFWRMA